MKKCMYIAALFAGALALHAQSPVTMHAPFEFVAAGRTLPAGDYRMELLSPGAMLIAAEDSGSRVLALVNVSSGSSTPGVAFDNSGSTHVLTSVSSSTGTWYLMGTAPAHITVALRSKK